MKNKVYNGVRVRNRKISVDIDLLLPISAEASLLSILPRKKKKALKKKLSKLLTEIMKNYIKEQDNG